MKSILRMLAVTVCAAALPALANPEAVPPRCADNAVAVGMHARLRTMSEELDRASTTVNPAAQRRIMDLHAKQVHEGSRELRKRQDDIAPACRLELMQALLEQLAAHQTATLDIESR